MRGGQCRPLRSDTRELHRDQSKEIPSLRKKLFLFIPLYDLKCLCRDETLSLDTWILLLFIHPNKSDRERVHVRSLPIILSLSLVSRLCPTGRAALFPTVLP